MSSQDFNAAIASTIQDFTIQYKHSQFERSIRVLDGTTRVPERYDRFTNL